MKNITVDTTVGEIVRALPARSRVFENLEIDYCCGGKKSLAEVCQKKGLDPATVVAMLTALDGASGITQADPDTLTLSELCDHIERVHHGYLREELPRLDFMTQKVAAVHGDSEPRLAELRNVFETFNAKVNAHTQEEDEKVFPAIRNLETVGSEKSGVASWLAGEFEKLEAEHEKTGAALTQFNALTDSYTPPDWACNTFRALYDALARLEKDMHQHVHEENNVLFPKARALARTGAVAAAAVPA
ncbi:MAG TPA: iron-sulfur cluster repair di-iron protein [Chthoniobacterales bacterium]